MMTVLCYIEHNDRYLMLHRTKKKDDLNAGKWLGVGGKLEPGETPEEALVREVKEETGLTLTSYTRRGLVTFVSGEYTEYLFLFTADKFKGSLIECEEGLLKWVEKCDILSLPLWEGDAVFLSLLTQNVPYFSLKLCYDGDRLISATEF